ncbi:MAG: hypothetical protein MJA30_26550 [Cytophagales bacterium]|nr:hypothetical protein [Cytophagales bacterium]
MRLRYIKLYVTTLIIPMVSLCLMISCEENDQGVSPNRVLLALVNNEIEAVEGDRQEIKITLVKPTERSGTITIDLNEEEGVIYGTDYTTDPEAIDGVVTVNVPAGAQQASFAFVSIQETDVNPPKTIEFTMSGDEGVVFGTQNEGSVTFMNKPELTVVDNLVDFGDVVEFQVSASQEFRVTGKGLTNDLVIEAQPNFEVSIDNVSFEEEVSFSESAVNDDTVTVFVRFAPVLDALGTVAANIEVTTENGNDIDVPSVGTGLIAPPTIILPSILELEPTFVDSISAVRSYQVRGYRLTNDVELTAPPSYDISLDDLEYDETLSIDFNTLNTLDPVEVFVRFKPVTGENGLIPADLSHTSVGAITKDLALSGVALNVIAFTSFEEPAGLDNDYFDLGSPDDNKELVNNIDQAPVQFTSVGGEIGFRTFYVSTGSVGATDGDDLGVTTKTSIVDSYPDGTQGYYFDDTDGLITVVFDQVDASSLLALKISLDYFINPTDYEPDDYFEIIVESGDGVPALVRRFTGVTIESDDIEEGIWKNVVLDVTSLIDDVAVLKITVKTDSGAEEIYFDNIRFFGG